MKHKNDSEIKSLRLSLSASVGAAVVDVANVANVAVCFFCLLPFGF